MEGRMMTMDSAEPIDATSADTGGQQARGPNVKTDPMIGKATQFKPGQSGNPAGKPKGARNFKTIVREILEDGGIDWDKVPVKNAEELKRKHGKRGGQALAYVMLAKGLSGDVPAAKAVSEWAYGKNIDITSDGERVEIAPLVISKIVPRDDDDGAAEAQAEAS